MTWIHVSDPNAEDVTATSPPPQTSTAETYQQVAAHTLEALSTAAADHTSYPPQGTAYYTAANAQNEAHPEYGFVQAESAGSSTGGPSSNVNYYLSDSNAQNQTDTSLIDPNLETSAANGTEHGGDGEAEQAGKPSAETGDEEKEQDAESRLAITLREFNELEA